MEEKQTKPFSISDIKRFKIEPNINQTKFKKRKLIITLYRRGRKTKKKKVTFTFAFPFNPCYVKSSGETTNGEVRRRKRRGVGGVGGERSTPKSLLRLLELAVLVYHMALSII